MRLRKHNLSVAFAMPLSSMLLFGVLAAVAGAETSGRGFSFKQVNDKSLGLWEGDRPVLVYRHGEMSLPSVPAAGKRSSYIHPIYGLDGEVLTDDFPADHYHHHGLFWGWPHVKIAGREYDLWKMRGIRIEFQRWLAKDTSSGQAKLGVENGWFVQDNRVMKEEVWLNVHPASRDGRNVDVKLIWTPIEEPITLSGAEGKSYGGLSLRFAPRTGTTIKTPSGRASDDLLVTRLPWADLSAKFEGASHVSGAALFVHPRHPNFPPEWMTRDYGLLAVGWPGVKTVTIRPEQPVQCQYRLWLHRGKGKVVEIAKLYDAYQATKPGRHEK